MLQIFYCPAVIFVAFEISACSFRIFLFCEAIYSAPEKSILAFLFYGVIFF